MLGSIFPTIVLVKLDDRISLYRISSLITQNKSTTNKNKQWGIHNGSEEANLWII